MEKINTLSGMQISTRPLADATRFGMLASKNVNLIAHFVTVKSTIQVSVLKDRGNHKPDSIVKQEKFKVHHYSVHPRRMILAKKF